MTGADALKQDSLVSAPAPNFHDHAQSQTALSTLESGISKWLLIGGVAAAAVLLAPIILPYFGIGGGIAAALSEECCTIVGINSGIAGGLAGAIENIPVIGSYISTAAGKNILVPAVTILGGESVGTLISNYEKSKGKEGSIGAFVRLSSLAVGVVLAAPAVLPGIGHGAQFLTRLAGADPFGVAVAQFLGNTSACTSVATANGIMGGTAALAAHLPCAIPAVITSFALAAPAISNAPKKIPTDDLNHTLTAQQQAWVDAYNAAPAVKKPILQKWFRDQGFNPDFHADGSMHLYKHGAALERG